MKRCAIAVLVLATFMFAPAAARAAEGTIPLVSFGLRGGMASYTMGDMNVEVNDINDILTDPRNRFDELEKFGSGPVGGAELRVRVLPYLAVAVTTEYLFESSKVGLEVVGEEFREIDIHASTVPVTLRVMYVVRNATRPKLFYTMGAGVSYLTLGRLRSESAPIIDLDFPRVEYATADADGMGMQLFAGAEYFVKPWLSVGGELLYRYAKLSELTYNDNDQPVLMNDGSELAVDFSGFNVAACFRAHLF
ncbi:MAG: outer membrane beta-barrel protein [Candidatus Eisenbacteria bacterium]|nr:outer membrane beta-barrel protein [Candidatus Eisenbacteria bacterium]